MSIANGKESPRTNYFIVIAVALTMAIGVAIPVSVMPVLFMEMSRELNLDYVQIGSVWGIVSLGSIFVTPLGGIICDRLGNKRAIVIIGLLSGILGAFRGISNDFISLLVTTFLFGIIYSAILPALSMVASVYSSKEKQAMAQGVMATGGGFGLALGAMLSASWLSPLLGGWRNVFYFYGGVTILFSLLWLFIIKDKEITNSFDNKEAVSMRQAFGFLMRFKLLWILSLSLMLYQSCSIGMQGYLAYHLENFGWTAVSAGGVLAMYNLVGAAGAIPFAIIADRLISKKSVILLSFLAAIIGVGLLSVVHNYFVWILVILVGIFCQATTAMFLTMCIEIMQGKAIYSGTAIGLMISISCIGRTISPPIGNSLAGISASISLPFLFWAALAVAGAFMLIFIKETRKY